MWNFLTFRKLITPYLIQPIMWLGVLISIIQGIVWLVRGIGDHWRGGPLVLTGLGTILFGPVLWRIWGEVMIIIFRLHDKCCVDSCKEPTSDETPAK